MAVLKLKYYGAQVLQRRAKEIPRVDRELISLASDMLETMYSHNGVGLAAPQVGHSRRLIVVDCGEEFQEKPMFLINPEVVSVNGSQIGDEGCLSFPELFMEVERPQSCVIKAWDLSGEQFEVSGDDLLARCFLHEIDHLNGALFIDFVREQAKLAGELPLLKDRIAAMIAAGVPQVTALANV
ncbi:MAG: peptide deformylase [Candidatus Sericytochromatia bacterium]|nr:peptide deformylase [Candidatus Sericytochromatia bacterium]